MNKFRELLALFPLFFLAANLASAQATVDGRVDLPKTGSSPVMNKRYSMASKGGMLAMNAPVAVVYLEGSFPRPATLPPKEMMQQDVEFVPNLLAVEVGTRVEFPNRDEVDHSVYSASAANSFNLGRYGSSERPVPARVFDHPGLITLRCDIHESMRAQILVLDTPYLVLTSADGRYRLEGLPAGNYVLKAWLNGKTTLAHPVELKNGAALTVNFP